MARSHDRSHTPDIDAAVVVKKLKTSHVSANADSIRAKLRQGTDASAHFADSLFDHNNIARLNTSYRNSQPYRHAVVEKLFQDDLLQNVKDECLGELSFTEKETDIYKYSNTQPVNQTGDLASLDYLSDSEVSRLPSLLQLRDALYSPSFRQFLQNVTGCGPLSGKKQDMSVNSYTNGCHLLNHDDVIGTRRVSYILYMPLPHYQLWKEDWGGALELYPVKPGPDGQLEPESVPSKIIPPSWNQFIFFEVQPGQSFHSVEEVVVGGGPEDGRERLSISGWFHAPQEGEEGYVADTHAEMKSSREQLASTSTDFKEYTSEPEPLDDALSEEHISFLSEFLNPVYLQPRTMQALSDRFVEESSLELHSFLCQPLAEALEPRLRELDSRDGLGKDRERRILPHSAGTTGSWTIKGPPHKWRYCTLKPHVQGAAVEVVTPRAAHASSNQILRSLQEELFPSKAFRAWLNIVSRLMPMRYFTEARRFRPGLDYTLATSEETEARLDVVLGLTPRMTVQEQTSNSRGFYREEPEVRGWDAAEWGGWECYMAPHNEEDDPAVYRSSTHKKSKVPVATNGATNGKSDKGSPAAMDDDAEGDDEEEDSTLLTVQPGFNRLLLVLRDERVMRFVKYISAAAEGSRWDVCGEYEIGMVQEEEMDEDSS
ncbi:Oxoglutarate and iron-dependent oxygenase degradation C-term-domain-containing protein [Cyathus striatus]|nr:Oxoglutarate and iron-dependent oxygenase degradation C-term-domain-containing protein [Cyathus striatus]